MTSQYTRSGARRAGDDFQDIIALALLVEWLEHPDRYKWVRLEADDAGFLDDIVAMRADGVVTAKQVKFSAHPEDAEDPYSWADFLKQPVSPKGKTLPSLLSKWGESFRKLKNAHTAVEGSLVSNRRPADDLKRSFSAPGVVELDRIDDAGVRAAVIAQLVGEQSARDFFAAFRFDLDQAGLDILGVATERRFFNLHGEAGGWQILKEEVRRWVRERNLPPPDGFITLSAVQNAAEWQRLEKLPEEFAIPEDFVIPADQFHTNLLGSLITATNGCVVLTGPPGIGKSTFISNLYQDLQKKGIHVVRHHFFLSRDDRTSFRYDHRKVAGSLISELQAIYARLSLGTPQGKPRPEDLSGWLSDFGTKVSARGGKLVVILDGLDHVWSDVGSVEELNRLFQLITPVPAGVILLIGTQPVDPSRLPRRLSDVAPRDRWLDLPALEYPAVRRWVEIHATELRAIRNGEPDSHRLDELAHALWRKSEGYPLHLRYLLKSIDSAKGFITAKDIQHLPELPHHDIRRYYERFWDDLEDAAKQVLCLLATCDFQWSRIDIADCLDPAGQNTRITSAIRQITHLTNEGALGLQLAHNSLEFFIRQRSDYEAYAGRIRELALRWLQTRAPDLLRWSYEWLLAGESGDEDRLLHGPSRSWLIESMARRYPAHIAARILTRSAAIALKRGQLDRFLQVSLSLDYLSEATDSRDYSVESLLAAQLGIREDPLLLERLFEERKSLGNLELLCLAESCERVGMTDAVGECFDTLNARIRIGQVGGQQNVYPRMNAARCLARVAAFASEIEPRRALEWLRAQKGMLWIDYTDSLRVHKRTERLRAVVNGTGDLPAERSRALAYLVLVTCEDGLDFLIEDRDDTESMDPLVVIARTLSGESNLPYRPVATPEPWILQLKEYEFYQYYDDMAEYLWRMFFVFTANCLCGKEEENVRLLEAFADEGWIHQFLGHSVSAATSFARHLRVREFVGYSWILAQFSELEQPDFGEDRTGHGFAVAGRKAIFRLAMDLQALQGRIRPPTISANDIETTRKIPLFVPSVWLEIAVAYRRSWFTEDGLAAVLRTIESYLASNIEDFGSRAELCEMAAQLAALHADRTSTAKWIRECWSNLIAYGYHKDLLLDQCLDAAEYLRGRSLNDEALQLLAKLAPAICAVRDYTDGDETRHLPIELGRILFKSNLQWFVKYHEWLGATGKYWEAHSIFEEFVAKADLGNPVFRAVAGTGIERENLVELAERSSRGDEGASECLDQISLFHMPSGEREPEQSSRTSLFPTGPMPNPADFPAEKVNAFLEAAKAAGSYRLDEDMDDWARFWVNHGRKEAVLNVLENYDNGKVFLSGDTRLRIELTLQIRGRQAAYEALVAAHGSRYGWNRYFGQSETIRYIWSKLKEIYPERWLLFLQRTLMNDPAHISHSGVTARSYISRLLEFLLFMEQTETAKNIARTATDATLELIPLKLPDAQWIPKGNS